MIIADGARARSMAAVAYWRAREVMTDAQILAEFCAKQRADAKGNADQIEQGLLTDDRIEAEIRRTGSEIG